MAVPYHLCIKPALFSLVVVRSRSQAVDIVVNVNAKILPLFTFKSLQRLDDSFEAHLYHSLY